MNKRLIEAAKRYDIPRGAFKAQFAFDRVGIWQVSDDDNAETFKGTNLFKPEITKSKDRMSAPRGVLVGAGLNALDYLKTHGFELGDVIWVIRLSPWRREVDVVNGQTKYLLVARVSDLVANETLAERMKDGARYEWSDAFEEHVFVDESGKPFQRMDPAQSEDY